MTSTTTPLVGTAWRLLEVDGQPVPASAARPAAFALDAEQHRYATSVGCNQIAGPFELDGAQLRLAQGVMTRMACPPPLDRLESSWVALLPSVTGYRIAGDRMELLAGDRVVARLAAP
jgi:heat shock protein HslJ